MSKIQKVKHPTTICGFDILPRLKYVGFLDAIVVAL